MKAYRKQAACAAPSEKKIIEETVA